MQIQRRLISTHLGRSSAAVADFKGLTIEEAAAKAKAHGLILRVTKKDGEVFFGTMDYRLDRVNVEVKDGRIVGTPKLG